MAEDYFAAMERVEKRLDTSTSPSAGIAPEGEKGPDEKYENVKVLDQNHFLRITEKLTQSQLENEERLALVDHIREAILALSTP